MTNKLYADGPAPGPAPARISRREVLGALLLAAGGCSRGEPGRPDAGSAASPAPRALPRLAPLEDERPPARVTGGQALRRFAHPTAAMDLAVISCPSAIKAVSTAMEAFGGMARFVSRGSRVVISPNFAWARPVGSGATCNPGLVRQVILACQEAGAREILCLDYTMDPSAKAFSVNRALRAVQGTRARLLSPASPEQHVLVDDFEQGTLHRSRLGWQAVPAALLTCDVFIVLPVIKHHRVTRVSGAVKKLMGCVWRRVPYHRAGLDGCLAELAAVLRPSLVIADATAVLGDNGPDGPGKVLHPGKVIVGTDPVLVDSYGCGLLGADPRQVAHLAAAAKLGAGSADLARAVIEEGRC